MLPCDDLGGLEDSYPKLAVNGTEIQLKALYQQEEPLAFDTCQRLFLMPDAARLSNLHPYQTRSKGGRPGISDSRWASSGSIISSAL